ncbi:DUF5602 domain-containing protein [Deinococcus peraridilitoris]|uniref:TTHB210-like domain-containing protein n=1 Tax=Deinococcus peraridilitoris (strain DSM 19664 / LMG 22246 / CIP 109416 / KR-200) TaxID=937777 RepID=L0A075_DEIPD|nr:DUF5602 domain-containing protein [Deinococcus peraridilitoris]AFZ66854.1 hypothetical protein Deipe_1304 [Deinococcus peraridilitoris DSM 19664]
MKLHRHLVIGTVLLLAACAQNNPDSGVVQGESQTLNGASVNSWAKVGQDGQVIQAGVTIPMASIQNGPTTGDPVVAHLDFPVQAQQTTFLNHLSVDWNPQGHPPMERYGTPHFDFHVHGGSQADVQAINCADLTQIDPANVPQGWLPPVPPGDAPQDHCVPTMGFHSLPTTEFASPGVLKPGLFDKVMIVGSYKQQFVFLEPMVTREQLLRKESFTLPVPMPRNLGRTTRYPTKFEAVWDNAKDAYHFILSDFQQVQ